MADVTRPVDRRTEAGAVYELVSRGAGYDILVDGRPVMRSTAGRIEKELVDLALAPWEQRDDVHVLLAGLGMGLTLRALLDRPQVAQVTVVERSPTVVAWAKEQLAVFNRGACADRRVSLVVAELAAWLRGPADGEAARPGGFFVSILDTDVWPESLSRPENVELYHEDGLLLLETALRPGGVLALATARRDDDLDRRLRTRYQSVARIALPTEVDGEHRLYYVYRGRRSSVGGGEG
jgi:predicted membrane-bound spermidine synthase